MLGDNSVLDFIAPKYLYFCFKGGPPNAMSPQMLARLSRGMFEIYYIHQCEKKKKKKKKP